MPLAHLVGLAEWTCSPDGDCTGKHETNLRRDGVHFEGDGAEYVSRWLVPQILDLVED